jgi:hypothetical protein
MSEPPLLDDFSDDGDLRRSDESRRFARVATRERPFCGLLSGA